MYAKAPTAEQLVGTGFSPEDYEAETTEIWPENLPAINLFSSITTQWRVIGIGGKVGCLYVGLDYNVMYRKLDRMTLTAAEYDRIEDDMRVIEAEALSILNKKD